MSDFFDAPPEGALQTQADRALSVKYKSNKTPEAYASATDGDLSRFVENGALGFHYYDKESKTKVVLCELTFVVLEVYAGIAGYDEPNRVSYWSNRVRDTRSEELIVYSSAAQGPILRGLYQQIKEALPASASYTKFVKAYCINLDRVIEIELTASSERGMQKAIAAAEQSVGRSTKWEKVFILGLAQNDHLWGFHLKGYNRETKAGEDYNGKGELYFSPLFHAGTVSPVKQKELHEKCREYQQAERDAHEAYKARNAAKSAATAADQAPAQPFPTTAQAAPKHSDPFPAMEPVVMDDLPF